MRKPWLYGSAALLGMAALAACGKDSTAAPTTTTAPPGARADVVDAQGQPLGTVTFTEREGKVFVDASFHGLPPGFHGFHVHTVGKCEPPFTTAGGHLTVGAQDHPAHAGDQPLLLVLADGTATIQFSTDRYTLTDVFDQDGAAVIVHAAPDNYGNVPTRYAPAIDQMTKDTGDAGARIGCGVIKR